MSVDISTLAIQVQSDGVLVASNRLKDLSDKGGAAEKSVSSLSSSADRLTGYLKAAAAALATWKLSEYIKEATLLAARVETLSVVMRVVGNNAGYTGAQMEGFLAQVKKMGITTQESMSSLVKMAGAQMDVAKAAQLARVAQDAAVIGGVNSSQAFGKLIAGIQKAETEILETIGINVKWEDGYKRMAETLGRTVQSLSAAEKMTARTNQVLAFGANIAGAYEASMGTAGKQVQSLSRYFEEIKLKIGAAFSPSFTDIIMGLADALKLANEELGDHSELVKALGKELVNPMGLLTDFRNLVVGTAQAVQFLGKALASSPGAITLIGIAAYSATGGIAALAAAFTALTTAILASLATNPVAWLAAIGGATYIAAKSAVKTLDELGYAYAGVNITGEAYYNAEQKRAKQADEAWENLKKKLIWMHREGGIKTPVSMQDPETKRIEAAEAAAEAKAKEERERKAREEAEKAAERNRRWKESYADLRKEIAALSPTFDEQGRAIADVTNKYEDLMGRKGANIALLQKLKQEHLSAIGTYYKTAEAIRRTSEEFKEYLRLAESETPQNNNAGEMNIRWESELELLQSLQPSADIDKLNDQVAMFGRLLSDIPDKAPEVAAAIESLKTSFANSSGLTSLKLDNNELANALMYDANNPQSQFEMEKKALLDNYNYKRDLLKKELEDSEKNAEKGAAIIRRFQLLEQKYIKDTAAVDYDAQRAKLQSASFYAGMAGDLFSQLGTLQDESSRKGFEAAKDYALAGAVVSTAAAVMNALATVQPYPAAVAAAAMAAATGAIQIAKIESTSFGGGSGSVSAPSGSFTASGGGSTSGGSIGKPYKSLQQSQDADVMERLAASMENASVEMRRVADGLVSFQDVLSNEQGKRNLEGAPNRYMATSNESSWLHKVGGTIMDSLGFESTKFIREGDWSGLFKQLRDFSLSAGGGLLGNALWGQGNKWKTTGGGVSLGITDGELEGMNYIDRKKSGGLLKSSKKKTEYSSLDEGFAYWLENTLGDVGYSTNLAANVLGTKANIGSVNLPTAKIKTSGRSTEDIQKDLEKWFQSVGNAFAKTVDGLEAFTAPGEEAFAALMRLATSLQTVNDNFNLIGKTLLDSSLTGGNTASKLADLFGGLEQFSESMETYFTSMFTDAEQQALLQKQAQVQVNSAFKEMGVAIPATKDAFKSLVNSLDVTTESGAQLFAALIEVAPAFADMIDLTEKIAKATRDFNADLDLRLMRLNGEDTSLFELRIQQQEEWAKAVDSGMDLQKLRIVQDKEWARAVQEVTGQVSDAVQDMVASAKSAVLDLIDAQIAIGKTKVSIMTGPLSNLSPEAAYFQSKSAFESVAGKTDLESLRKLPELAQAFLNASRGYNASGADYQSDLIKVLTELDRAMGITGGGISETQQQITLLENIKTAIEDGATDTVNQLSALLGPNSTLAGLIGTWSEATEAKLAQDKKNAAIETYYREQDKYTEAVKAIGADFAAGKITFADYTSQATALYSPVQTAWGTATDLGATGLTSTGIANPPARDDSRLLTDIKTKIYTELQGEFMGAYPPFEGSWTNERGNPVTASASYIASIYGTESAFAQLDRLINYARTYHIAGYAKGGFYPGGSALMGEVGPEFVDSAPGYVYRADETKALFEMAKRGIADNYSAELVAEIRELRREVAELRGTAEKGNRIAQAVGTELAEIGTEGNRQRGQVVKGERMRGAA